MKDYFGMLCAAYLNRRNKKQQEQKKKINDEKLKDAGARLKQLAEFVQFLNEKGFSNRHERKAFWRDVQEGRPVVEDTLKRILSRYGVKEESIEELEKRKNEKLEAARVQEKRRQLEEAEARRVKELAYIKNGICVNNGETVCSLGHTCEACRYNRTGIAKQRIEEKKDETKS